MDAGHAGRHQGDRRQRQLQLQRPGAGRLHRPSSSPPTARCSARPTWATTRSTPTQVRTASPAATRSPRADHRHRRCRFLETASIGDKVWVDSNANGEAARRRDGRALHLWTTLVEIRDRRQRQLQRPAATVELYTCVDEDTDIPAGAGFYDALPVRSTDASGEVGNGDGSVVRCRAR